MRDRSQGGGLPNGPPGAHEGGPPPNRPLSPRQARRIVLVLLACDLFLAAVCVANYLAGRPYWTITRLFSLSMESNVPTWFSTIQLAGVSLVAAALALRERGTTGRRPLFWCATALLFALLSLDEAAMLHEQIGRLAGKHLRLGVSRTLGRSGAWTVVLALPVLGVTAGLMRGFLRAFRGQPRALARVLAGLGLFVLSGMGVETLQNFLPGGFPVFLSNTAEETGEMVGVTLILSGLLIHLAGHGARERRGSGRSAPALGGASATPEGNCATSRAQSAAPAAPPPPESPL